MPVFISMIIGAIVRAIPGIVGQILVSLGFAAVTFKGVDIAIDTYKADVLAALTSLPPDVLSLIGYLKVGQAINIVFSAIVARLAYQGLKAGAQKVLVRR